MALVLNKNFLIWYQGWISSSFAVKLLSCECHKIALCHKLTLFRVMAWCRQPTKYHLSQCWPKSVSPYAVTRPHMLIYNFSALCRYIASVSVKCWWWTILWYEFRDSVPTAVARRATLGDRWSYLTLCKSWCTSPGSWDLIIIHLIKWLHTQQ